MNGSEKKDVVHGYEVKRAIIFENDRGFVLAENPEAVQPFVTWQFTEDENGARDYYWGHYTQSRDAAVRDYEGRVSEYQKDYGMAERNAYKYYSTQRPIDIGTFPKTDNGPVRFVNFEAREGVEAGRLQAWGYLVYDRPLTEKQISDYELHPAPGNPDVKERLRQQAQIVGAWEEKHGLPAINRYTYRMPDTERFVAVEFVAPEQMAKRYERVQLEASRAAAKKPIARQLAEGAAQAARENTGRPAPAKNKDKGDR